MVNLAAISIQKASTEESGVISIVELERLRKGFLLLSQVVDFPEEDTHHPYFIEEIKRFFPEVPEKAEFIAAMEQLQAMSLQAMKEEYTALFELNKRVTLYSTYYRFEDSRERGGVLAKLKMLYEMFGVELDMSEMTDYIPTMLEFLGLGSWDEERIGDMSLLFSVLEDGTYEILQQAEELGNVPYISIIRIIRKVLRYCVK